MGKSNSALEKVLLRMPDTPEGCRLLEQTSIRTRADPSSFINCYSVFSPLTLFLLCFSCSHASQKEANGRKEAGADGPCGDQSQDWYCGATKCRVRN